MVALITPIPGERFVVERFADYVGPGDTIYFILNVGNGDSQLILLPEERGARSAIVVDVATTRKLPALLGSLASPPSPYDPTLFPAGSRVALVVATHPHADHMGGMADFLHRFTGPVEEYWDPAYYSTNGFYTATMNQLAARPEIRVLHPAAGTQRFIGSALVTALGPSVLVRNQYDTLGVDPNNASIGLKVEFPVRAATRADGLPGAGRVYLPLRSGLRRLVLGADAQTDAWASVTQNFPRTENRSPLFAQLKTFIDPEPLRALAFKVPHHGSKRGLNLELIERLKPRLSIVTADGSGRGYGFPHQVAMDALREGLEMLATKSGAIRSADHDLGIHYTGAEMTAEDGSTMPMGSLAVVIPPTGNDHTLWRFLDRPTQPVDLSAGLRYRTWP